jgi:citrate lyase subunit beta/citryl-CoA lyase
MTVEAPRQAAAEDSFRPRRSCLYMPGANAKALAKARDLPADTLLFDLEDAVAPEAKAEARAAVAAALGEGGYGGREIVVRVNALSTEWGGADVKAALAARPHGVLFPKIQTGADIEAADRALGSAAGAQEIALWAMIETPLAILNIKEIAAAAERTRLSVFVMGTNDLAKDMRAAQTPDRAPALFALSLAVAAARAYGLTAIDGVYNDIANEAGFLDVCRQGRALGFDGKTLIHPSQLGPCNLVFSPAPEEVAQARDVIAAFADPANAGKGVLKVNGKMTELLHLAEARRLVAFADAVG